MNCLTAVSKRTPVVTIRKAGDRVGTAWIQSTRGRCEWRQRGRRMFCPYLKGTGLHVQGGHAEYMLMNADATYLIPDKISYEQAAPIFCVGYTVYSGLRWADPQPSRARSSTRDRRAWTLGSAIREGCRLRDHRRFALSR